MTRAAYTLACAGPDLFPFAVFAVLAGWGA